MTAGCHIHNIKFFGRRSFPITLNNPILCERNLLAFTALKYAMLVLLVVVRATYGSCVRHLSHMEHKCWAQHCLCAHKRARTPPTADVSNGLLFNL